MNRIESAAYIAACATLTGAGFREAGMPFSLPAEFSKDFPQGETEGIREHTGRLLRPLFDLGFNIECSALTTPGNPRMTLVVKLS